MGCPDPYISVSNRPSLSLSPYISVRNRLSLSLSPYISVRNRLSLPLSPVSVITRGCATDADINLYLPRNDRNWDRLFDRPARGNSRGYRSGGGHCRRVTNRDNIQNRPDRGQDGFICLCNEDECNHGDTITTNIWITVAGMTFALLPFTL